MRKIILSIAAVLVVGGGVAYYAFSVGKAQNDPTLGNGVKIENDPPGQTVTIQQALYDQYVIALEEDRQFGIEQATESLPPDQLPAILAQMNAMTVDDYINRVLISVITERKRNQLLREAEEQDRDELKTELENYKDQLE